MYLNVLFPLTKAITIMFELVTTRNQTLQTWVGHNAMRYHNFNVLPHPIPYIFTQFSMVLGLFATRYRQIYKKMYVNIFVKEMTVTRGNPLQITQKHANLRENI